MHDEGLKGTQSGDAKQKDKMNQTKIKGKENAKRLGSGDPAGNRLERTPTYFKAFALHIQKVLTACLSVCLCDLSLPRRTLLTPPLHIQQQAMRCMP